MGVVQFLLLTIHIGVFQKRHFKWFVLCISDQCAFLTFSCISHLMFDWYKLLVPVTLNWYPTYGLTAHICVLHPPISSRYQLIWMYFVINADRVRGKLMSILETVSSSDQVVSDLFIATSNFSGSRLFTRNFQINVNIHVGNLPQFWRKYFYIFHSSLRACIQYTTFRPAFCFIGYIGIIAFLLCEQCKQRKQCETV